MNTSVNNLMLTHGKQKKREVVKTTEETSVKINDDFWIKIVERKSSTNPNEVDYDVIILNKSRRFLDNIKVKQSHGWLYSNYDPEIRNGYVVPQHMRNW